MPGGWQQLQWNFLARTRRQRARRVGSTCRRRARRAARGVTVAVLDTGVAYANRGRFRRSPDFARTASCSGYDFVDDDAYPNDDNGHGTHVASTIAESDRQRHRRSPASPTARSIMPVRVLDRDGEGDAARSPGHPLRRRPRRARSSTSRFEFATERHARADPRHPRRAALRRAARACSSSAPSGNAAARRGRLPGALAATCSSVGATTEHGCLADYSNGGPGLDLVAPGGGATPTSPATRTATPARARRARHLPDDATPARAPRASACPAATSGTSMAAPHVVGRPPRS